MKSYFFRRTLSIVVCGLMVTSFLTSCTIQTDSPNPVNTKNSYDYEKNKDFSGTLRLGHFNEHEAKKLKEAFETVYPNVIVELQVEKDTNGAYSTLFSSVLRRGEEIPDVYASEVAFVKRAVNIANGYEDLSAPPYNAEGLKNRLAPYTIDIGRSDDGKIRALSHQAAAGAIGYKRDMAMKYFGTDDPEKIGEMFSTGEKIIETGKRLKDASGGKAILFPGMAELMKIYLGARDKAWVVDGKLTIDPKIEEYVAIAKELREIGAEGGMEAWSQQWSAAIQDDIHFAYAIPTWGVPWIIDVNQAEDQKEKGNWGLAKAPTPYTWGGTWFGIYSGSKNKELAWEFLKFITLNEEQAVAWAKSSGDLVSNLAAIETLSKDDKVVNKTVNQNIFEFFKPMIKDINGEIITQYDDQITNLFQDSMNSYLSGNTTKEQMWAQFKEQVRNDLGEQIRVE